MAAVSQMVGPGRLVVADSKGKRLVVRSMPLRIGRKSRVMVISGILPLMRTFKSVGEVVEFQAEKRADREMVVWGDRVWTYGQVSKLVNNLARELVRKGVGRGTRVGVMLPNCPEWLWAWWAIAKLGAVVVPVNPAFKAEEAKFIFNHAEVKLKLGDKEEIRRLSIETKFSPRLLEKDYYLTKILQKIKQ